MLALVGDDKENATSLCFVELVVLQGGTVTFEYCTPTLNDWSN